MFLRVSFFAPSPKSALLSEGRFLLLERSIITDVFSMIADADASPLDGQARVTSEHVQKPSVALWLSVEYTSYSLVPSREWGNGMTNMTIDGC